MKNACFKCGLMASYVALCALLFMAIGFRNCYSRDLDGRYAQSPLKQWFQSLTNMNGSPCCDGADGRRVDDAEWGTEDGVYWVIVDGKRLAVPNFALVVAKNRVGAAVVWPFTDPITGELRVRCFLPGSLS